MDEQKEQEEVDGETEEKKPEETPDKESDAKSKASGKGAKATVPSIEDQEKATAEMKAENDRREEVVRKEKAIQEDRERDGRSNAGAKEKKETPDEKWAKDAKERYAGTGLDPTPDDTPTTYV